MAVNHINDLKGIPRESQTGAVGIRLKFQVQHPEPERYRMLRWTKEASTSAVRNVA
jgi:hypothetical protein